MSCGLYRSKLLSDTRCQVRNSGYWNAWNNWSSKKMEEKEKKHYEFDHVTRLNSNGDLRRRKVSFIGDVENEVTPLKKTKSFVEVTAETLRDAFDKINNSRKSSLEFLKSCVRDFVGRIRTKFNSKKENFPKKQSEPRVLRADEVAPRISDSQVAFAVTINPDTPPPSLSSKFSFIKNWLKLSPSEKKISKINSKSNEELIKRSCSCCGFSNRWGPKENFGKGGNQNWLLDPKNLSEEFSLSVTMVENLTDFNQENFSCSNSSSSSKYTDIEGPQIESFGFIKLFNNENNNNNTKEKIKLKQQVADFKINKITNFDKNLKSKSDEKKYILVKKRKDIGQLVKVKTNSSHINKKLTKWIIANDPNLPQKKMDTHSRVKMWLESKELSDKHPVDSFVSAKLSQSKEIISKPVCDLVKMFDNLEKEVSDKKFNMNERYEGVNVKQCIRSLDRVLFRGLSQNRNTPPFSSVLEVHSMPKVNSSEYNFMNKNENEYLKKNSFEMRKNVSLEVENKKNEIMSKIIKKKSKKRSKSTKQIIRDFVKKTFRLRSLSPLSEDKKNKISSSTQLPQTSLTPRQPPPPPPLPENLSKNAVKVNERSKTSKFNKNSASLQLEILHKLEKFKPLIQNHEEKEELKEEKNESSENNFVPTNCSLNNHLVKKNPLMTSPSSFYTNHLEKYFKENLKEKENFSTKKKFNYCYFGGHQQTTKLIQRNNQVQRLDQKERYKNKQEIEEKSEKEENNKKIEEKECDSEKNMKSTNYLTSHEIKFKNLIQFFEK